jgi:polyisoprenyl-teichoic acid--peptidoglycan teichoic acid transferase
MRPTVYNSRPRDSYPAKLLRALYSAIIPGVGQLVAGVKRRGFVLLAIFVVVSLAGIVILTRGTDAILTWVVQPKVLLSLLWVNIVIMLVRMFAVIDAWMTPKLGTMKPKRPSNSGVFATGVGLALILVLTVAPHAVAGYYTLVSHDLLTSVFAGNESTTTSSSTSVASTSGGATDTSSVSSSTSGSSSTSQSTSTSKSTTTTTTVPLKNSQRITVLLIGTDAGYGRTGARADSINIASLDMTTGNVAMFGIPRNTAETPLGPKTAKALKTTTYHEIINSLYTAASKHPEIAADGGDPGAEALLETASLMLGIPIDYYVVVNMLGLADMVDAFGGVDINLKQALHITYAPLNPGEPKKSYVFKVGVNHLDGLEALAFARDRADSSDYVRMGRQRCVLLGLLYQNGAAGLTLKFPKIAAALEKNVKTDIPVGVLPQLLKMRSKIKTSEMISIGFVPPDYISGQNAQGYNKPNLPLIKQTVKTVLQHPDQWLASHPVSAASAGGECYRVK